LVPCRTIIGVINTMIAIHINILKTHQENKCKLNVQYFG
jgi:hypothetical protein